MSIKVLLLHDYTLSRGKWIYNHATHRTKNERYKNFFVRY